MNPPEEISAAAERKIPAAALAELDRAIRRIAGILAELARRTPPAR